MTDFIFDTDAGADCDDIMALTYLTYAMRKGWIRLLAVTHCLDTPYGVPAIRSFFRFFGEDIPPVGRMVGGAHLSDYYCREMAEKFAASTDFDQAEPAARVLRRALEESRGGCVICAVGQFTNICALLESQPDDISPLDGVSLVRSKCRELVMMAGTFRSADAEWNVKWDIPAAKATFERCPVPITVLPFETGIDMITGKEAVEIYGYTTPLSQSFINFNSKVCAGLCDPLRSGRHSWDPATAVYAVEGVGEFLIKSEPGIIKVSDNGSTEFIPSSDGKASVLRPNTSAAISEQEAKDRMAAYINRCADAVLRGTV
jgi:inosine-uridine nucleoside N-ribohydrolase